MLAKRSNVFLYIQQKLSLQNSFGSPSLANLQKRSSTSEFQKLVRSYFSPNASLYFYWKGRVALYAILRAMNIQPGDEVILPAYTCVVVPNAILYLGAVPIYVDIDPHTYNMDIRKLEKAITSRTKVIISQNTFGLTTHLDMLLEIAQKYHLYTIEDCTHGFGGTYRGKINGSSCDAAFFSTQWNKPFSTGLGGFALINNAALIPNIESIETEKSSPSWKEKFTLWLLLKVRRYLLTDWTYWTLVKFYRFLSHYNLILGSSQGDEITSTQIPDLFLKDFSNIQAVEGIRNLKSFSELQAIRQKNARLYSQFLTTHQKTVVPENYWIDHSFLKYPLLVRDRVQFLALAQSHQIQLGDWFVSPLHPVQSNFSLWKFDPSQYPVAAKIASQMVNLPTDIRTNHKIIHFLETYLEEIC